MKQINENEFEWNIKEGNDSNKTSRRDFLKQLGLLAGGAITLSVGGKLIYDILSSDGDEEKIEEKIEVNISSLKDKPIHLGYNPIVKDKDIVFLNRTGNKFTPLHRISRCLRRKPLTDAVEDRYGIPRGLLMAMMAQEGMGDPTMPNLPRYDKKRKKYREFGDGGLGLIHIQAINAHRFGLNTLKRYTDELIDGDHAELIHKTLKDTKRDLSKLVKYDDRFHPVMAVDVAARFLMDCKSRVSAGTDDRIRALRLYSGRPYSGRGGYGIHVIHYRAIINDITGDEFPQNFSKNIYQNIQDGKDKYKGVKKSLFQLKFKIDGEETGYDGYLAYFEESMQNFELQKYMRIGTYQDNILKSKKIIEDPKGQEKSPINTLITSEFVDTKQHNSEGFRLFRYEVKKGDSPLSISDNFDDRDEQNGDKYANTGNLNIVRINGELARNLKEGQVIYVKVRKN